MSLKLNISINEIHEVKICLNFIRPPCTYYPIVCINRNNSYAFDHILSWGIKNRTPYPINEVFLSY